MDYYPTYTGATTVIPSFEDQTLATKETVVMRNITVLQIPIAGEDNQSGGITITIG